MAESLGEKLRLAREARGITLSEVAAQTRIAARYLEAIEENNYKPLPGGVFNKGFIKAYAKYVGVDEQEALNDYARIVSTQSEAQDEGSYRRPSVMTDDNRRSSWSSMIFAVIILVLMTGGILALVQWYRSAPAEPQPTKVNPPTNTANSNTAPANTTQQTVSTDQLKVEIRSMNGQAPFVATTVDAEGKVDKAVPPAEPRVLSPQNMVKVSYSKSQTANLQLTVNGKVIALPTDPLKPTDGGLIKFEINKNNAAQILSAGQITAESQNVSAPPVAPASTVDANTNTATNPVSTASTPRPVTPKPAAAKTPPPTDTNTAATTAKTPVVRPTVITVPPTTPRKPGE